MTDWSLDSFDISLMLDISVWDISGKKKSRFGLVADPSVAIIVILSMEIAGNVILMSVTSGSVAAPKRQSQPRHKSQNEVRLHKAKVMRTSNR